MKVLDSRLKFEDMVLLYKVDIEETYNHINLEFLLYMGAVNEPVCLIASSILAQLNLN